MIWPWGTPNIEEAKTLQIRDAFFYIYCVKVYYTIVRQPFGILFRYYSEVQSKLGTLALKKYVTKGISYPVFDVDIICKLRRVRSANTFIFSGTNIIKRLWRQQKTLDMPCPNLHRGEKAPSFVPSNC